MISPKLGIAFATVFLGSAVPAFTAGVQYNTNHWFAIPHIDNQSFVFDHQRDAQTGDPRAELVGDDNNPGFYFAYDSDTNGGLNQGRLLFRVRVAAFDSNLSDKTVPTNAAGEFGSALFIGIDANGDGAIDIFVVGDDRGSASDRGVKIYFPDCKNATTGCHMGPSTTGLGGLYAPGTTSFVTTGPKQNFNWAQVSLTTDPRPGVLDTDVATPDEMEGKNSNYHNPDGFFSFAVDVKTIGNALATLPTAIAFSQHTEMRFIAITAQNQQSFNQDTGGCQGTPSSWACGFSDTIVPIDYTSIPEPGTYATMGAALVTLGCVASRRRRKS